MAYTAQNSHFVSPNRLVRECFKSLSLDKKSPLKKKFPGMSIPALVETFKKGRISDKRHLLQASLLDMESTSSSSGQSYNMAQSFADSLEINNSFLTSIEEVSADKAVEANELWIEVRREARATSEDEPALASYLYSTVLSHRSLERSLAFHLANKLSSSTLLSTHLFTLMAEILASDEEIMDAVRKDMKAVRQRDAACDSYIQCMLNFKGFLAIQTHRIAHKLWKSGRKALALALQSRISEVFHVDIHPAARFGKGVMFDHATGIVIGETAEIGNNVSMLHHVTLGGTGKAGGERHPKVRDGVLIGAGATILGNIEIGEGAKIGAGSMVLSSVPPKATAVGNPARLVGEKGKPAQLKENPSDTMDHRISGIWTDYVI